MNRPTAVVIKLDSITGLDTARILSGYKIPVVGIADDPGHYCCKTNSCKEILFADTSDGKLVDTLLSLARKLRGKPALFPCSDESVRIVSDNRERLGEFYNFVIPDADVLDLCMNKQNFYRYAMDNGLPIPATFFPSNKSDLEEIINKAAFPYIVKPVMRTPNWFRYFKNKVIKVMSPQELSDVFETCSGAGENVIVQEWIKGGDSDLYSCIFYHDKDYNQSVTFTSRKLRQWFIEDGEACLAEECRNDPVLNTTADVLGRIKFRGIGSIEFKLDNSSGRYFIIEPNIGRPVLRIALVEAAGVPILHTMYCDASGLPLPANAGQRYAGVKWILLHQDIRSARAYYKKGGLSLVGWLKSLYGVKSFADLSMRDPLPFVSLIYTGFLGIFKDFFKDL